jgi:hypothetical protein
MIRSGREFAVSEKMLGDWGECIRVDWELRNSKLQSNTEENRVLMESIIKNNAELQMSNILQMKEIKMMRQDIKVLRSTIENFEGLFKDIRQHLGGTPSKKRKLDEVIWTEHVVSFCSVQAVTPQSHFLSTGAGQQFRCNTISIGIRKQ